MVIRASSCSFNRDRQYRRSRKGKPCRGTVKLIAGVRLCERHRNLVELIRILAFDRNVTCERQVVAVARVASH